MKRIMKSMRSHGENINNTRGFVQAELLVGFMLFMMILSLAISVLPVFIQGQTLNYMANEIVRIAEITGSPYSVEVTERINELKHDANLTPDSLTFTGTEFMPAPNGAKVQMNKKIKVTIKYEYDMGSSYFGSMPIELTSVSTGRSEVYTK